MFKSYMRVYVRVIREKVIILRYFFDKGYCEIIVVRILLLLLGLVDFFCELFVIFGGSV